MWHASDTGEMHTGFWWGYLRGKRLLGRCRRRWQEDNIKMDLQEMGWIWLRIGTGGGLLWTRV